MTPGTYQRRGEGTVIRYLIIQAFLGRVLLAGTEWGISTIRLGPNDDSLLRDLQEEFNRAVLVPAKTSISELAAIVASCRLEDPFQLIVGLMRVRNARREGR